VIVNPPVLVPLEDPNPGHETLVEHVSLEGVKPLLSRPRELHRIRESERDEPQPLDAVNLRQVRYCPRQESSRFAMVPLKLVELGNDFGGSICREFRPPKRGMFGAVVTI
jgi:hypothetical protein